MIFFTISGGTPAGPHRPNHRMNSNPGTPLSAIVGTSGSAASRFGDVAPSTRSFPACTCWMTSIGVANIIGTWPDTRSMIAGPPPL